MFKKLLKWLLLNTKLGTKILKWAFPENNRVRAFPVPTNYRHPMWDPKEFVLVKALPGIKAGATFRQTYQSDNVYFYAIGISARIAEKDQVGIIQFEAEYVEKNPEWFINIKEYRIKKDIRNDHTKFFYD